MVLLGRRLRSGVPVEQEAGLGLLLGIIDRRLMWQRASSTLP